MFVDLNIVPTKLCRAKTSSKSVKIFKKVKQLPNNMHQNCKRSIFIHHVNEYAHKNVLGDHYRNSFKVHSHLFRIWDLQLQTQFPLFTKQKKEKEPLERERGLTISTTTNSTSSRMIHIVFLKLCAKILGNQQELPFCVCLGLDLLTLEFVRYYFLN